MGQISMNAANWLGPRAGHKCASGRLHGGSGSRVAEYNSILLAELECKAGLALRPPARSLARLAVQTGPARVGGRASPRN